MTTTQSLQWAANTKISFKKLKEKEPIIEDMTRKGPQEKS